MAGPEDYMGGSRAPLPASYAAPLVGFQIGDRLANLPEQAFQGTQRQRATELQQPILDPNGQPSTDMATILREANKRGGLEYAMKLMPFLQRQELAKQDASNWDRLYGGGGGPPPIRAPGQRSELPPSTGTAMAPESGAADTTRSIATEMFPNRDVSQAIPRYASQFNVGPDDPLTPGQVRALRARMSGDRTLVPSDNAPGRVGGSEMNQPARSSSAADASANAVRGGAGAPPPQSAGVSGAPGPIASPPTSSARISAGPGAPTQAAEPAAGGGNLQPRPQRMASATAGPAVMPPPGAPPMAAPGGGAPGPQPQPQQPPPQMAQAGPPARTPVRPGMAPVANDPAAALMPPALLQRGVTSQQYADWLMAQARQHAIMGDTEGAKLYQEQAKPILDLIKATAEPTGAMKEAGAEGRTVTQQKATEEQQKQEIGQYAKLDTGIQALANTSTGMLPTLQAADSLLNAGAATGWGSDKILASKQILARIGGDPNGAMTLEAFGKQMAAFINQQTNTLKSESIEMGGSSMRIFSAQIENMQKASPSPDYTPAGNRYLIEVYRRGIDRANFIANQANEYKTQKGGGLDANFETWMRRWQTEHPMFSEAEMKNPRLVSPPTLQTPADAAKFGIKEGDPVRLPNGKIKYYHGPQQPKEAL